MSRNGHIEAWIGFAGLIVAALVGAVATHYSTADVHVNVSVPSGGTLGSRRVEAPAERPTPARIPSNPQGPSNNRSTISKDRGQWTSPTATSLEYDLLAARFNAVSASLAERSSGLNGLPVKPEISAALDACRRDLEALRKALTEQTVDDTANERLQRVRETLKYLESL